MPAYKKLQAAFVSGSRQTPLAINPTDPPSVLVENDQLTARILFIHRLHPHDPEAFPWEEFFRGRRRRWQLIMQVKFKVVPDMNSLFFGMELRREPMKLNLAVRAVCMAMLSFVKAWAATRKWRVHYSFGDAQERAAMCFPIFAVDKIAVSSKPPPVPLPNRSGVYRLEGGQITDFSKEEKANFRFDTEHWYTMDYFSSFVDFCRWESCNVPGIRDSSLETFWGQQPATVVLYDLLDARCRKHTLDQKRFFFEMEVRSVPADADAGARGEPEEAEALQEVRVSPEVGAGQPTGMERMMHRRASDADSVVGVEDWASTDADDDRNSSDINDSADVEEEDASSDANDGAYASVNGDEASDADEYLSVLGGDDDFQECLSNLYLRVHLPWYFVPRSSALASGGDSAVWWLIEVHGLASGTGAEGGPPTLAWRSTAHLRTLCAMIAAGPWERATSWGTPEARHLERLRRSFQGRLEGCAHDSTKAEVVWRFCSAPCTLPAVLHAPKFSTSLAGAQRLRGHVAFAEFEGRVSEQSLSLEGASLTLGPVAIPLEGAEIRHTSAPAGFAGAGAFLLRIGGAKVMRFLCSREGAATWVSAISRQVALQDGRPASLPRHLLTDAMSSGRWLPVERTVLNDWDAECAGPPVVCPLEHTAELLRCALRLHERSKSDYSLSALAAGTQRLQGVDLAPLTDTQLWAFWANVFHLLVVHAWLLLGPPGSIPQLVRFFNRCSYIIAGQAFSIAEVEHLVLRTGLSAPRGYLSRFVLQVWRRTDQELSEDTACRAALRSPARVFQPRADWRVSLLLANGTRSSPDSMLVFDRAACASQAAFERVVSLGMSTALARCSVAQGVIELPYQLCRFRDDAPGRYEGGAKQPADTCWLPALRSHLGGREVSSHTFRREDWRMHEQLQALNFV